jgi:starch phosphorylase
MVREYAERAYIPAHLASVALAAGAGEGARDLAAWRDRLRASWPEVGVRSVVDVGEAVPVGSEVTVDVYADLGGLAVDDVRVEVVAGVPDGDGGLVPRMIVPARPNSAGSGSERHFVAVVPAAESGRLACAARVVALRPDGRPDPGFLVTWAQ